MSDCLFCKLANGAIPTQKLYEDDDVVAFNDLHPVAAVHFLIVPKLHIDSLAQASSAQQNLLGKMLLLAPRLAAEQGLHDGFRTVINTGAGGGQTVFHLHMHVFGGQGLKTGIAEVTTH